MHHPVHTAGDQPDRPNFITIITDAHSDDKAATYAEANATRAAGVTILSVGIRVSYSRPQQELRAIAVDVGPGLFTGLRVGLATGITMAQTLGIPMLGISSLDLLAWSVRFTDRLIVPVVDARRDEVFYAIYQPVPGGVQRVEGPIVAPPDDLLIELTARGGECLLVGDGAIRHGDLFDRLDRGVRAGTGNAYPAPTALVDLAHHRALREEFVAPHEIEPVYLRDPEAVANWTTRVDDRAGRS